MRKPFSHSIISLIFLFFVAIVKAAPDTSSVEGRWDITIDDSGKTMPSWLEVVHSGLHTLVGQFVGAGGSARPISKVNFNNGKVSFSIPPQWETGNDLSFEATMQGDRLTGTITFPNGKTYNCSAVRAPSLKRSSAPSWGKPVKLFNGTGLTGWHASGEKNQWVVENGILKSAAAGSNLVTDASFTDFKLHVEFRYATHGNSGVYLRGRYEVQILDDDGTAPPKGTLGAVYGFLPPSETFAKKPGDWQTYDITLTGRMVTIVANNITIICNQEIPGITGGALNCNEGEPGPIMLQGDHEAIEYRNIVLIPAK
jgi:hypothetical protein